MASEYNTRVSEGFPQAGNNVALSRMLLSVGTIRGPRGAGRMLAPRISRYTVAINPLRVGLNPSLGPKSDDRAHVTEALASMA
jgi:hypothetical protein